MKYEKLAKFITKVDEKTPKMNRLWDFFDSKIIQIGLGLMLIGAVLQILFK
ncbi:MAG: hypothetical protein Q7R42_00990 [Candidatus Planktophila sp.]|nr:hypothetical protein [Candidatus Planktophila sp.]